MLYRSYEPNTAYFNRAFGYINAMSENGIAATMCFFWPNAKKDKVDREYPYITFRYYWEALPQGRISKYISYVWAIQRFFSQLRDGDIVYVYNMQDILSFLIRKKGIKVFHEVTEHPSVYKLGTRLHFVSLSNYLKLCRKLDGLFVISTALRDFFIQQGVNRDRITIVNMTVDPSRFEGLNKLSIERYIAYCGTVSNNKDGVDQLIKAFSIVVSKYPDVKLYIIGSIPSFEEQKGNIHLIEELGLQKSVVLTGMVQASEMPQLLKNAEVLALARPDNLQAKFGFPTKLGEYLLTENPVVVTKVGDIPLFLEDRISALLCEPGNVSAFADSLKWALSHKDKARIIGKNGAVVAKVRFNSYTESKKLISALKI